jgi:indole-3-glycerol phosphate synthase
MAMSANLDQIIAATRRRVEKARLTADLRDLERRASMHVPRGFRQALKTRGQSGIAVISELKKASPSKGLIRADFHPAQLAKELEQAGAAALSVLTDEEFFQGSLQNLEVASSNVKIPCLRKDFMIDEFQVLEARAHSADAILLIVAALTQAEVTALSRLAKEHGLDVLCEVHDPEELQRALDAGCDLIGVNSRDLRTFKVDLQTTFQLAEKMPKNVLCIAESGIHNGADMARLRNAGYGAFLIGESLMKEKSPGEALKKLLAEAMAPAAGA